MEIKLNNDFKEFLKLLNDHKIDYILVGGYAVGFYGYVRATADIDFWIRPELSNAEKAIEMLKIFGFPTQGLTATAFLDPKKLFRMGLPPVQIELFTSLSGLDFNECFADSRLVEIDSVPVRMISLEHLKLNKKAVGRLKDQVDLEHLS